MNTSQVKSTVVSITTQKTSSARDDDLEEDAAELSNHLRGDKDEDATSRGSAKGTEERPTPQNSLPPQRTQSKFITVGFLNQNDVIESRQLGEHQYQHSRNLIGLSSKQGLGIPRSNTQPFRKSGARRPALSDKRRCGQRPGRPHFAVVQAATRRPRPPLPSPSQMQPPPPAPACQALG